MYIFYYLNSFKEITCKFNMPIINNLDYESTIEKIEKEEQVIELIKDVAVNIHMLGFPVGDYNAKSILQQIEHGKYDAPKQKGDNFIHSVDLSKAQALISQYRKKSEGGCQSCMNLEKHYEDNETYRYCNVGENKDFAINSLDEVSPKVEKYFEKGCEDRKPIFSKTIEEILEEAN